MSPRGPAALLLLFAAACSRSASEGREPTCAACAPNLVVDEATLGASLAIERRAFAMESCEVAAGCVAGDGERWLLRFASSLRNAGDGPLAVDDRHLAPARCGEGRVLRDFFAWRIRDSEGEVRGEGSVDLDCIADGRPPEGGGAIRYTCNERQGLQPGWIDDRVPQSACAFVDLGDLAPGDYELELVANAARTLPERETGDNAVRVPLRIPKPPCPGSICGGVCCPAGVGCVDDRCALPDLIVDEVALVQSLRLDEAHFAADDCAVEEGCVGGTGLRRLLRFTLSTPNVGGADLFVGDPARSAEAVWSACHQHFHMMEFARYRLLREDGTVAAAGHKQAFCLMDTEAWDDSGPIHPRYDCEFQGISRGWTDSYGSGIDCQWVDVTGVPEGNYLLEVVVNGEGRYPESDRTNNEVVVPVFLPADPSHCVPREEVCGDGRDQNCDGIPDDGCPPLSENVSCETAHPLDGSGLWTGRIEAGSAPGGSCGGSGGALHFGLHVLAEEIVYLSTYGSAIDTVLRLERGACGATTEVACIDDACGTSQSHFAGALAPGRYDVVVQARDPSASGEVKLQVERSGCSGARPIPAPGLYEGDTSAAAPNDQPSCALGSGPDERWYLATCPGETHLRLSTCAPGSFDTVLELRRGSCRGLALACNDDGLEPGCVDRGSVLRHSLSGPGLAFLLVDGYLATDRGPYLLQVEW